MTENPQPKRQAPTQNQPRREKFIFEGADQLNFQRHKSISTLSEIQNPEPRKQVFLRMPSNYQEAYLNVVNQITGFFNEVREGLYESSLKSKRIAQILENLEEEVTAIDNIEGCIELLREGIMELINTTKHIELYDYESLLQETEAKVREHIRNEQQLKVVYEALQFKLNEAEKDVKAAKAELETVVEDNSRLTALLEKKDSEINHLYAELAQKDQTLETQFQTMNKMIAEFNLTQVSNQEKITPSLSNQRINDYRPILSLAQTASHKYTKTPSPTKGLGIQKAMTPDNLHIVASFKVLRTSDSKKGEQTPHKDTVEFGTHNFEGVTNEETSETDHNTNFKTKIVLRTSASKDPERGTSMKPPLRERSLQGEKTVGNLSQTNLKYKDLLAYGFKNNISAHDKGTSKEVKAKFIEELEKIFKVKRQNNHSVDMGGYNSTNLRSGRDSQIGHYNSSEIKEYSVGRKEINNGFNGQVIGSGVRQSARLAVEVPTKKKRPSTSLNNKHQDGSTSMPNSKSFAILKQKILGSKTFKGSMQA